MHRSLIPLPADKGKKTRYMQLRDYVKAGIGYVSHAASRMTSKAASRAASVAGDWFHRDHSTHGSPDKQQAHSKKLLGPSRTPITTLQADKQDSAELPLLQHEGGASVHEHAAEAPRRSALRAMDAGSGLASAKKPIKSAMAGTKEKLV